MSNKKHPHKPAESKLEVEIATEAAIEQEQPTDKVVAEEDAAAQDSQEDQAAEKTDPESDDSTPDPVAQLDEQASEPAQHTLASMIVQVKVEFSGDLATRLTKTVTAIAPTGKPEDVHALHKVEMLVGDLKTSLPAAIKAMEGDQLGADLLGLLASL